jgi:hypothetical protein
LPTPTPKADAPASQNLFPLGAVAEDWRDRVLGK